MDDEKLNQMYRDDGWDELAEKAGFSPVNTESPAHRAFSFWQNEIDRVRAEAWKQGMDAAVAYHRTIVKHDQSGLDYSEAVGVPLSNADELCDSVHRGMHDIKNLQEIRNPHVKDVSGD